MRPTSGEDMVLARQHADIAKPLTRPSTRGEGVAFFMRINAQGKTMMPKKAWKTSDR
jgi:hypothetical protein